jgi:hypothetical protein
VSKHVLLRLVYVTYESVTGDGRADILYGRE